MIMMNTHPREELISAMADGKLSIAETRALALHLRECASCRAVLTGYEQTKAMFRALAHPEQPAEQFWNDTYRKMRATQIAEPEHRRSLWGVSPRQARAGFALAACLAVAVVAPLSMHHPGATSPVGTIGEPAVAEDALDPTDVSSFVRAHTQFVASQPLSDPDRQQMIAADAAIPGDDQSSDAAEGADVAL
jgi:anti-sigma factor RsiW